MQGISLTLGVLLFARGCFTLETIYGILCQKSFMHSVHGVRQLFP